jgi:hypothetical protein
MSIRKTVTLDDDVVARVKRESQSRGASFRDTLNDLLGTALLGIDNQPRRRCTPDHCMRRFWKSSSANTAQPVLW